MYPIINKCRNIISLNGIWDFRFSGDDEYQTIYVPGSFNNQLTDPRARYYKGLVEYKTEFTIPDSLVRHHKVLRFDAVTHNAIIYIDGKRIAEHKGGFLPFEIELDPYISTSDKHILQVEVDNSINHKSFPVGNESGTAFFGSDNPGIPSVENAKKNLAKENMPNFDFFNYAGITRNVRIYTIPRNFIKDISIISHIEDRKAIVEFKIETSEKEKVKITILDENGESVGNSNANKGSISILNPHLWNPKPEKPYLYKAHIETESDEYDLNFGIRSIEVKGNKFLINGKPFYFKGAGKHEDSFIKGRGIDEALNVKDVNLLHWLNANSFRTSHYPYAEEMYSLCDREGIVIIDEAPAVGLNFQGQINPYKMDTYEYHEELINDMIERDKNHPSVVMWSLGNEPDSEHYPSDSFEYWHRLYESAHAKDPENRPVTMVCCQNDYTKDITTKTMDVICINRYYGWYNLSGSLPNAVNAFNEELDFWETINKPLILTEYGADAIPGFHSVIPEMFTEEFQVEYLKAINSALDSRDFVIGEHPWCFADFDTQQGPMRAMGNHKGLFTRDRCPKMSAHYEKERWSKIPNTGYKK